MKTNLRSILFGLVILACATLADDLELVNIETGEVKVDKNLWRPLTVQEAEAYRNPGKEIPVWKHLKFEKAGFWHQVRISEATNVVVFRDDKMQSLQKEQKKETWVFLLYKALILLASGFMVQSNLLIYKGFQFSFVLPATATILLTFFSVMTAIAVFVAVVTVVATFFAFVAAFVAGFVVDCTLPTDGQKKVHYFFSGLFYILTLMVLV